MTAPISNEPTTTRLHHYAGHYCGCGGVIGCIVAAGGVLCAKKFALLGLMVGVSAKKFARRTKNGRKSVVCGVLDEFLRTNRCCAKDL